MRSRLDQIENRLQTLIESSVQFLPWGTPQNQLAHRLVEAMQHYIEPEDERYLAPGLYTIYLHPENLAFWQARPDLLDALAAALNTAACEAGVRFVAQPTLHLAVDPNLPLDSLYILCTSGQDVLAETANLPAPQAAQVRRASSDGLPVNAFLIINGDHIFTLDQVVINIGRRTSNHLIIDDPRVSRNHAQLRAIRGRYVLFDLNSTGGTYVNGQRIVQQALKPGDVISLAGVPLIYGEDAPASGTGPVTSRTSPTSTTGDEPLTTILR